MGERVERVFITGASSGLGEALARRLAGPGVRLGLLARRGDRLEVLARELGDRGAEVSVYVGDVCDGAFVDQSARAFLEVADGVDWVIANAGIGLHRHLLDSDAREIARVFEVNVIGVSNTVMAFADAMVARGSGVLAAVGSVAGCRGIPGTAAYSASKIAVQAFMDTVRMELRETGVHAMTLCPGYVLTPLTDFNEKLAFVIDAEAAADQMVRAIESECRTYTFPWQLRLLSPLLRRVPEGLLARYTPMPRRKRR